MTRIPFGNGTSDQVDPTYGTAWYTDPARDLITIVVMQRAHAGDQQLPWWHDIWSAVHQTIDR